MITTEKPQVNPTGRYSQAETARLLGVNVTTIWRWANNGRITIKRRSVNGIPFITGIDIIKCWEKYY